MKNKMHQYFLRTVCAILSLVMFVSAPLNAFAAAEASKPQYVKDVKLIYAQSESEARSYVPEGYTLLAHDLNEGTEYVFDVYEVYLAYATTENPDEAITDLKMMNMNGGFVYSDYEKQLKNVKDNVKQLANDVKTAVAVFVSNYEKGTYGAKAAYRTLSLFTVDEANDQNLADYFLYSTPPDEFYIKLVLNAHQNVLSSIFSALTMAVQGQKGDTWLDRLAKIENPIKIEEQPDYWDKSGILWEHFYGFYQTYNTIDHDLFKDGNPKRELSGENDDAPPVDLSYSPEGADVSNTGIEALYELAYWTLKQYSFGSGEKFNEWFVGDTLFDEEYLEMLYCLLEVMTPAEYAMMRLCGPLNMILSTGMNENTYVDYADRINQITGGNTVCSIWAGVNTEIFRSSIGVTDAASRAIAKTEFEQELNNEGDSTMEAVLKTAGLVAACGVVSLGIGLISYYSFGAFMLTCFSGTALTTAASNVAIVGTIFGATSAALGVTAVVVALVVAVIFLWVWLDEWWAEHHIEYTEIPEYMYDYVEDGSGNSQFLLYEGVKFQDGRVADVNAWEGKQWHAMYVSRDKAAGAPIEADFIVRHADGRINAGYAGLSNFGEVNAENLNRYADDDEVSGIYVTYRQQKLTGDFARGAYLSLVKLFSEENAEKCRLAVENEGFVCYDINLTPDAKHVTYLGYKTTNSARNALTDIRVAFGYNSAQYAAGGGSQTYAACGSTSDGQITLYTTSISLFGTPIRSDFLVLNDRNAPAGYEPVNLFSGGPAVSFNLTEDHFIGEGQNFYLFFRPSVTYTDGTEYLGGVATVFDIPGVGATNSLGSVQSANMKLGYKMLYTTYGTENAEGALLYTTTYNPYRAIYGITAVSAGGDMGNLFAETISYNGVGYSRAGRYLISHRENIRYEFASKRQNDSRLYTAGVYSGGTPMLVSDLHVSQDQNSIPSGFTAVSSRLSSDGKAVDLAKAFNFEVKYSQNAGSFGSTMKVTMNPLYLFVRGAGCKEGNYLTHVYLTSKEEILGDVKMDCDDLDNSSLMNYLAAQGANRVVTKNLNLEDSNNITYLAYTKKHKDDLPAGVLNDPITNLILYYAGETDAEPESEAVFDGITYHLTSGVNIFCEENGQNEKCKRVYLYYTTNPAAGSPVMDIVIDNTPILNGWSTVRTQNGKALYDDMDAFAGSMWFVHMKRTFEEPKYIEDVVIGVGGNEAEAKAVLLAADCDYMLEKDLNNNVGAHSDYIYLGYKRTTDPSKAIRDLRTTHDDEVDSFDRNGSTYYKIDGNLNSYTNVFADDIFLYYTKDSKAGTPLTSLGTSQSVANWTHGEGGRYVVRTVLNQHNKASDLNSGASGDYIYLLQTRDKLDEKGVASMIGGGSVMIIIGFAVVSAGAIAWVSIKKKKCSVKGTAEAELSEESE